MAVYAALAQLDRILAGFLDYDAALFYDKPFLQEIFETVRKKLKSFVVFMERLDWSSRIILNDSLQQVEEAAFEFRKAVLDEQLDELNERSDAYFRFVQDFRQKSHSFIDTLEKMEEEYLKLDTRFKSKMVGLSDEYIKLKTHIIGYWMEDNELIFSLVGMAGIGKTALANKLFQDLDILEWFDCCAWVTVGRDQHQPEEISQIILAQLGVDEHNMCSEGYLVKYLLEKRCLIVLDDVWDMEMVMHCLQTSSPITINNGSRLLVTTRIRHQHSFPCRLLNEEESWNLLCEKIFAQNSCPPELEKAGKMIADKCDGLPLTIVTVADLLSKTPRSEWVDVATRKKHQLFTDAYDEISKVLYPSYDNLPVGLRLCFLYMAIFPQNYEIPQSKLINLLIVEKIISGKYFGEGCLQDFAMRNIVMVYQRSSTLVNDLFDKIKTCRLHSSWWHFCYKEAQKINFFHILDSYTDASSKVLKRQGRLAIHNNVLFSIKTVYKLMEKNCASTTHSLLCVGPYNQYPVPMCFGLRLLKKLDALEIRFYEFPLEVLELVKLRYLALTCNGSLPPSISKLWKLQYLIVRRHLIMEFGAPSYLPVAIWDMKRLKHLHVTGSDLPDVRDTFLPNLLTLSDVSFNSCTNGMVGKIPNIKKLGIRIHLIPHAVTPLDCFDHVSHLSELESLKYIIVNPTCNFGDVAPLVQFSIFPLNLKKLTLSGLGYPWEKMSMISSLPNLEVLKLRHNAFRGPLWEVEKDKFPKLSYLQMEDIDLAILEGEDSFKCLKKLSIKHCYSLRKLCFTMKYELLSNFEVVDCNPRIQMDIQNRILNTCYLPKPLLVLFSFSWST